MSFPVDGAAVEITDWLRTKLFAESIIEIFANWDAEAMLGVTEIDLKADIPVKDGKRLWALLNTAKSLPGKFVAYSSIVCVCLSMVLYDVCVCLSIVQYDAFECLSIVLYDACEWLSIVLYDVCDACRLFCMMSVYACRLFCVMPVYACRLFSMMPVNACRLFCMMSVYACRLFV